MTDCCCFFVGSVSLSKNVERYNWRKTASAPLKRCLMKTCTLTPGKWKRSWIYKQWSSSVFFDKKHAVEFSVHVQQTQKEELTDLPPPPGKQSQSWNLTNSDVFKENKLHLQQLLKHIVNKTQIEEKFLKNWANLG